MTNNDVAIAFSERRGGIYSSGNMTVVEDKLYSYQTCITQYRRSVLYINSTKYSRTTSKHLTLLLRRPIYLAIVHLQGVPIGTKDLHEYATR